MYIYTCIFYIYLCLCTYKKKQNENFVLMYHIYANNFTLNLLYIRIYI